MMNLMMRIPENVGWCLVGASAVLCVIAAGMLTHTLVLMWKSYHEVDDEEAID